MRGGSDSKEEYSIKDSFSSKISYSDMNIDGLYLVDLFHEGHTHRLDHAIMIKG